MHAQRTDLSKFAPEHHAAIERVIQNADGSAIIAEPFRYLPNSELSPGGNGHTLVAFRERHDMSVTPSDDRWYAVLDVDTETVYQHEKLRQAWHDARGWKGPNA